MSPRDCARSVAVIGGGVIGLSVARRTAQDGWAVRVHRTEVPGASWVAGGMLAPHSEGWPGEEELLRIGLASLALWRAAGPGSYLDGLPPEVVTAHESLVVAVDRADAADLKTVGDWLAAQGHPVQPTTAARDIEPLLAQGIRHGFCAGTELAVDNRAVVAGLADHCERIGVQWAGPVNDLADVDAETVVIANGLDAPSLWPGLPVRAVKGEVPGCAGARAACRCRAASFAPGCTAGRCIWCRGTTAWWSAPPSTNTAATPRPRSPGCGNCSTTPAR